LVHTLICEQCAMREYVARVTTFLQDVQRRRRSHMPSRETSWAHAGSYCGGIHHRLFPRNHRFYPVVAIGALIK